MTNVFREFFIHKFSTYHNLLSSKNVGDSGFGPRLHETLLQKIKNVGEVKIQNYL